MFPLRGIEKLAKMDKLSEKTENEMESKTQELLEILYQLDEERLRGEESGALLASGLEDRDHLLGMCITAQNNAERESEITRLALDTIHTLNNMKYSKCKKREATKQGRILTKGELIEMRVEHGKNLPLWVGDVPPPLCGALPPSSDYTAQAGDTVAAYVKGEWIMAEIARVREGGYEVDDVAEKFDSRCALPASRIIPLPRYRADPRRHPEALFPKGSTVLALYVNTTCFYEAVVDQPPPGPTDPYQVLFRDEDYRSGFSPSQEVYQQYIVAFRKPS